MPELDVSPVQFRVNAQPIARVGVTHSAGAQVVLVPVPGPPGEQGPPGEGGQVFGETPAGTVDGINTVYTISQSYRTGSTAVYLNGLREDGYTETAANTITFDDPPIGTDSIRIDYIIQ